MKPTQERSRLVASAAALIFGCVAVAPAVAEQVTGVLGSPSATTTIDGKQLPPPNPPFGGVIKEQPPSRPPGGRRASCRRRARPTCCLS